MISDAFYPWLILGFFMSSTFIYEYLATICIDLLSQLPLPYLSLIHIGFLCVSIHCKIIEGFFFLCHSLLFALIVFSKVAVVGQAQLLEAEVIPININVMFTINRLPLKELDKD